MLQTRFFQGINEGQESNKKFSQMINHKQEEEVHQLVVETDHLEKDKLEKFNLSLVAVKPKYLLLIVCSYNFTITRSFSWRAVLNKIFASSLKTICYFIT